MSISINAICDGCQLDIEPDSELYCSRCWLETIATLPIVERELRALAGTLTGDAARRCEDLADRIYDLNTFPAAAV